MKKIAVVYLSKCGHTKQYADWLKEEVDDVDVIAVSSFNFTRMLEYKLVIFACGVYGDKLAIMDTIKKNIVSIPTNKTMMMAVSWYTNDSQEAKQRLIAENYPEQFKGSVPLYVVNSGLDKKQVSMGDKATLLMAQRAIEKKDGRSSDDINALAIIKGYSDQTSKDNLASIKKGIEDFFDPNLKANASLAKPAAKPKTETAKPKAAAPNPAPAKPADQLSDSVEEAFKNLKAAKPAPKPAPAPEQDASEAAAPVVRLNSKGEVVVSSVVAAIQSMNNEDLMQMSQNPISEVIEEAKSAAKESKPAPAPAPEAEPKPAPKPAPAPAPVSAEDDLSNSVEEAFKRLHTPKAAPKPAPAPAPAPAPEADFYAPDPVAEMEVRPAAPEPAPIPEPTPVPEPAPVIETPAAEAVPEPAPAPAAEPAPRKNSYMEMFAKRRRSAEAEPAPAPAPESASEPAPEPAPASAPTPAAEVKAEPAPQAPAPAQRSAYEAFTAQPHMDFDMGGLSMEMEEEPSAAYTPEPSQPSIGDFDMDVDLDEGYSFLEDNAHVGSKRALTAVEDLAKAKIKAEKEAARLAASKHLEAIEEDDAEEETVVYTAPQQSETIEQMRSDIEKMRHDLETLVGKNGEHDEHKEAVPEDQGYTPVSDDDDGLEAFAFTDSADYDLEAEFTAPEPKPVEHADRNKTDLDIMKLQEEINASIESNRAAKEKMLARQTKKEESVNPFRVQFDEEDDKKKKKKEPEHKRLEDPLDPDIFFSRTSNRGTNVAPGVMPEIKFRNQ